MKRLIITVLLFLATPIFAGENRGLETKTVFVPIENKELLASWIEAGLEEEMRLKNKADGLNPVEDWETREERSQKIAIERFKNMVEAIVTDTPVKNKPLRDYAEKVVSSFIFDINEVTKEGWEIKDMRRVWVDLPPQDNKPHNFEWGTEYTLQRPMK